MAATVTKISGPYTTGDRFQTVCTVQLDNSYTTGGGSVTQAQLGFAPTADPHFNVQIDNTNGWNAAYDYTNQKILLWAGTVTASTQATATTDVSTPVLRVVTTGHYRA
jgi:hypothetical protein